ncbi:uncharacterized protein K489DRAFT_375438 [Dissoconium aciculare CBS 342.82]|uniref:Uncharacterized protein n=1 Tax=Dissoconium aciculare CBS 342.82 TaxID=1314786 RepID=A0A6J3MI16_9PEZI|nr:uncharacterized protein K489DRAFT_375438 [Dissoconium aciculare CBS 342.82]KAF1827349.1 hypothetical protein K489DRAFT_375438 [Dissoconium aciculare CBS 342.82]
MPDTTVYRHPMYICFRTPNTASLRIVYHIFRHTIINDHSTKLHHHHPIFDPGKTAPGKKSHPSKTYWNPPIHQTGQTLEFLPSPKFPSQQTALPL